MIITELNGGLGNQMFQYAIGRCLAEKNKTELNLDVRVFENYPQGITFRKYGLDAFNIIAEFAKEKDISRIIQMHKKEKIDVGREKGNLCFQREVLDYPNDVYLQGYWQCEKYFLPVENIIRKEFTLKNSLGQEASFYAEKIKNTSNTISLHIRRGDYVNNRITNQYHGTCSLEYYYKAIEYLKNVLGNINIYVFSDDIAWCKSNLILEENMEFLNGFKNVEDLYLMSCCKHNIIANSSFSWWGAWLNPRKEKMVVAPEQWFKKEDVQTDIVPRKWIRL